MMALPSCQELVAGLSDYLDREQSWGGRLRFRLHLVMCRTCRRYFRQFEAIYRATGRVRPADLPEDFDQVMGRVLRGWLQKDA